MKIIAANKRANYDYLISQKLTAGIILTGSEVKSLRINTGSIRGSYFRKKWRVMVIKLYKTIQ